MRALAPTLLCVFGAAACGESSGPTSEADLDPLPTIEQARTEAAAEISAETADEEFERLKRELEAED